MSTKWTKARLRKFQATMAAKREARLAGSVLTPKSRTPKRPLHSRSTTSALVWLGHSKKALTAGLKSGAIQDLDASHMYAMLALDELTGGR